MPTPLPAPSGAWNGLPPGLEMGPPERTRSEHRAAQPATRLHRRPSPLSLPDAIESSPGQWRATVFIGLPGQTAGPKRCEFPQVFASREAAVQYATEQCERQAGHRPVFQLTPLSGHAMSPALSAHRDALPPGQSDPAELPVEPDKGQAPIAPPLEESPASNPLPRVPV